MTIGASARCRLYHKLICSTPGILLFFVVVVFCRVYFFVGGGFISNGFHSRDSALPDRFGLSLAKGNTRTGEILFLTIIYSDICQTTLHTSSSFVTLTLKFQKKE